MRSTPRVRRRGECEGDGPEADRLIILSLSSSSSTNGSIGGRRPLGDLVR